MLTQVTAAGLAPKRIIRAATTTGPPASMVKRRGYRIDLLVDSKVIVEVKAIDAIQPVHESQLLTYLRLSRMRVGLLINFGAVRLRDGIRRKILGF